LKPGSGRSKTMVSSNHQQWPFGLGKWPDGIWQYRSEETILEVGNAVQLSRRCDKGEPVARRGRKATGLSEMAGLPNRGRVCAAKSAFIW
jgi:hypothetical protein